MRNDNSVLTIITTFLLSVFIFMSIATVTYSATDGNNIVINEVQVVGTSATDEFVELYNPTDTDIDITGWRLTRFTSTGSEANLVSSLNGIVGSKRYYLVTHPDYDGTMPADETYSASSNNIPADGAVRLYSDAGVSVVDTVGFGASLVFEGTAVDTPATDGSVSRTNALDTDSNFDDFVQNEASDPVNDGNSPETTPSPAASAIPSATPTESPTESPTATATPTASPTESPTSTPSANPSATPTDTPSDTPTISPSVEPSDSPTPEPTSEPTEAPVRSVYLASFGERTCKIEYRYVRFGFFRVAFPRIVCS